MDTVYFPAGCLLHSHPLYVRKGSQCISSPSLSKGSAKISSSSRTPEPGHLFHRPLGWSLRKKSEEFTAKESTWRLSGFLSYFCSHLYISSRQVGETIPNILVRYHWIRAESPLKSSARLNYDLLVSLCVKQNLYLIGSKNFQNDGFL